MAWMPAHGPRPVPPRWAGSSWSVPAIRGPLTIAQAWLPTEAIQLMHQGRPNAVPAWEAHRGCREDLIDRLSSRIELRG